MCLNVVIEPRLQPLDGENFQLRTANREDEARLDVRATGFWSRVQEAFFDAHLFTLVPPLFETGIWQVYIDSMKER